MAGHRAGANSSMVVDVTRLSRQPGSVLEIVREVSAPSDFAVAMARVPEDSVIELDFTCESVVEGIWVSGNADVHVTAECSRCLEPSEWSESVALEQMYRYPPTDARGTIIESDDEDEDTPMVLEDTIDIEGPLRDAVVLALPLAPLCSPDCQGICAECGERLVDGPHDHPLNDPRWSALESLLGENPPEAGGVAK